MQSYNLHFMQVKFKNPGSIYSIIREIVLLIHSVQGLSRLAQTDEKVLFYLNYIHFSASTFMKCNGNETCKDK